MKKAWTRKRDKVTRQNRGGTLRGPYASADQVTISESVPCNLIPFPSYNPRGHLAGGERQKERKRKREKERERERGRERERKREREREREREKRRESKRQRETQFDN